MNYTTPIAYQDSIYLIADFEGEFINTPIITISQSNTLLNIQSDAASIELNVFPLNNKTIIYMFAKTTDCNKKLRSFISKFNCLNDDNKLLVINYLILLYGDVDRVFLSPHIKKSLLPQNNKKIEELFLATDVMSVDVSYRNNYDEKDFYVAMAQYSDKYRLDKFMNVTQNDCFLFKGNELQ